MTGKRSLCAAALLTLLTSCGGDVSSSDQLPAVIYALAVVPPTATVDIGATVQLTAMPSDSAGLVYSGRSATWSSSSPAVATASSSGLVLAVAEGVATVSATLGGKVATATITVRGAVASIAIVPSAVTIGRFETVQLVATPLDAAGVPISGLTTVWSTHAAPVGTVDQTGLVTGVGPGIVSILARIGGKTDSARVSVHDP